jgi:transcriptional regulator with XRE-family HTH domain
MDHRPISYLRPLRRRWGLTQRELAFLLGAKTHSSISQVEALRAYPSLANAIACAIIFDTPPFELFPELYAKVHRAVLSRAEDLYQDLQGDSARVTRTKLDFLEEVLGRTHPYVRDIEL